MSEEEEVPGLRGSVIAGVGEVGGGGDSHTDDLLSCRPRISRQSDFFFFKNIYKIQYSV